VDCQASKPVIVVDTREKHPYTFGINGSRSVVHAALLAGDYSLQGYETQIAIERKSLDDYVQTIIHSQDRFSRELTLLRTYPRAWIVVEATLDDILQGRYTSRTHPNSVLALTASIMTRYGIPVLFASDRPSSIALVESLLMQWYAGQQEGR
jgi:DNA excision repair protein ERCC-4